MYNCNKCETEHIVYGNLLKGICIGCAEKDQMKIEFWECA